MTVVLSTALLPSTQRLLALFLFILLFAIIALKDCWNMQGKKSQIIFKTHSFMTLLN